MSSSFARLVSLYLFKGTGKPLVHALVGAGIKVAFLVASKAPSIPSPPVASATFPHALDPTKTLLDPGDASISSTTFLTCGVTITVLLFSILNAKGFFSYPRDGDTSGRSDTLPGSDGGDPPVSGSGDPPDPDPTNNHDNDPSPILHDNAPVASGEEPPSSPPTGVNVQAWRSRWWILWLILIALIAILLCYYYRNSIRTMMQVYTENALKNAVKQHWLAGPIYRAMEKISKAIGKHWLGRLVLDSVRNLFARYLRHIHAMLGMLIIYVLYLFIWLYARAISYLPRKAFRQFPYISSVVASALVILIPFGIYCGNLQLSEVGLWCGLPVWPIISFRRTFLAVVGLDLFTSTEQMVGPFLPLLSPTYLVPIGIVRSSRRRFHLPLRGASIVLCINCSDHPSATHSPGSMNEVRFYLLHFEIGLTRFQILRCPRAYARLYTLFLLALIYPVHFVLFVYPW
jgi:hypothetical protein